MALKNRSSTSEYSFIDILFKSIPAIVFIFNEDQMIYEWISSKTYEIIGYKNNEIMNMKKQVLKKIIHPNDIYIFRKRKEYFFTLDKKYWSGVYRVLHKQGHWVWIYTKLTTFDQGADGTSKRYIGIALDVTDSFVTLRSGQHMINETNRARNHAKLKLITKREGQVIRLISRGFSYREISEMLHIQPDTVNKHRKNIESKLSLRNIASIAYFAKENGIA